MPGNRSLTSAESCPAASPSTVKFHNKASRRWRPAHRVKPTALQQAPTLTDLPRGGQGDRAWAGARWEGTGPSARTGEVLAAVMTLAAMALVPLAALRLTLALLSMRASSRLGDGLVQSRTVVVQAQAMISRAEHRRQAPGPRHASRSGYSLIAFLPRQPHAPRPVSFAWARLAPTCKRHRWSVDDALTALAITAAMLHRCCSSDSNAPSLSFTGPGPGSRARRAGGVWLAGNPGSGRRPPVRRRRASGLRLPAAPADPLRRRGRHCLAGPGLGVRCRCEVPVTGSPEHRCVSRPPSGLANAAGSQGPEMVAASAICQVSPTRSTSCSPPSRPRLSP